MCHLEQNEKVETTFNGLAYTTEKYNYNTRSEIKNLLNIRLSPTLIYEDAIRCK